MTLAQVQAAVALVVALMATWAGLVMAVALLLPVQAGRAESALTESPKRCLGVGAALLALALIGYGLLIAPNALAKLLGLLLLLGLATVQTLGAAGIAQLMGRRIGEMSGAKTSFGALARGSLLYSLALFFPGIGWYLFAPVSALCALGAGAAAVRPARRAVTAPPVAPPATSEAV